MREGRVFTHNLAAAAGPATSATPPVFMRPLAASHELMDASEHDAHLAGSQKEETRFPAAAPPGPLRPVRPARSGAADQGPALTLLGNLQGVVAVDPLGASVDPESFHVLRAQGSPAPHADAARACGPERAGAERRARAAHAFPLQRNQLGTKHAAVRAGAHAAGPRPAPLRLAPYSL